ncbi:MAG: YneF family protein [Bacilli bacterium]
MSFEINTVGFVFIILGCIIAGLVGGFFIARKVIKKEIDKNPPFNESMIKAMYKSMGRTPSQAQVNQTMRAIKDAQKSQVNGGKK